MRMPEELERQYVVNSLVAAGVLVPTGEEKILDLPLPESPAKIPISFSETLGLKTLSTPPVIEFPKVSYKNDLSRTARAPLTKHAHAGVKANRNLSNLRNTILLKFSSFMDMNFAKPTP